MAIVKEVYLFKGEMEEVWKIIGITVYPVHLNNHQEIKDKIFFYFLNNRERIWKSNKGTPFKFHQIAIYM